MSQPLRSVYIVIVIAVHEASAAVSRRVGEGPVSVPPASSGSSTTIVCPSTSTSWR